MSAFIKVANDGPEIIETNYFDTEHAGRGYCYLSPNAGTFRLLVPDRITGEIEEWRSAREVIISRGPWPDMNKADALEILFEDDSDSPYVLHMTSGQVERMPLDADRDRKDRPPRWKLAVWTRDGKILELPCRYRVVKKIPYLKPF